MLKENMHIELKKKYTKDILKTVVAFANTSGGKIYIGIDDNSKILGVKDIDSDILKLSNSIRDAIKPDVTIFTSISIEKIDGKDILVVDVQKSVISSVPVTEAVIFKMIRDTDGENFEDLRSINQILEFNSLIEEFEQANIKLGKSQMRTFNIIDKDGLYTNLGLLLSEECPYTMKATIFEGNTKEVFKDRFEFSGSLIKQMKEVYSFLNRNNRTQSQIKGLTRIDTREYPEIAIRFL